MITSRDAKSACFQGSRTSCDVIIYGFFGPNFGQKRSHHVVCAFLLIFACRKEGVRKETPQSFRKLPRLAIPPACYRSLSGPSGPKCPRSVPKSVPESEGCPGECPTGCSRGPSGPGSGVSKKCPESVPGVSKRCPGHSRDTLGDTPGTLRARRARETPVTAGRQDRNPRLPRVSPIGSSPARSFPGAALTVDLKILRAVQQFPGNLPDFLRSFPGPPQK